MGSEGRVAEGKRGVGVLLGLRSERAIGPGVEPE